MVFVSNWILLESNCDAADLTTLTKHYVGIHDISCCTAQYFFCWYREPGDLRFGLDDADDRLGLLLLEELL